ncbi:MAG: DUF202 domain-containing protein [Candidatus Omnitrophota bacterium]
MEHDTYSKFTDKELILRDYLATDRTILANERTFLAYIRTALSIFGVGVSFLQFFDSFVIKLIGWIFIPAGVSIFIIGVIKYQKTKTTINKIKENPEGGK